MNEITFNHLGKTYKSKGEDSIIYSSFSTGYDTLEVRCIVYDCNNERYVAEFWVPQAMVLMGYDQNVYFGFMKKKKVPIELLDYGNLYDLIWIGDENASNYALHDKFSLAAEYI